MGHRAEVRAAIAEAADLEPGKMLDDPVAIAAGAANYSWPAADGHLRAGVRGRSRVRCVVDERVTEQLNPVLVLRDESRQR